MSATLRHAITLVGAFLLVTALPQAPRAIGFGAVGDSLTDEYQGSAGSLALVPKDLPGLNWIEQLAKSRGLDFGSHQGDSTVRDEPRLDGFAHNWARFGATALDTSLLGAPPFLDQVAGLAGEIASGAVQIAYVGIGSNDVGTRALLGGSFTSGDPSYESFRHDLVTRILSAVDTLRSAGDAMVVLGGIPSSSLDPAVFAAVNEINGDLFAGAAARGIPFTFLLSFLLPGSARLDSAGANLLFDGFQIPLTSLATASDLVPAGAPGAGPCATSGCATAAYALNFRMHDGIHPNTIVQGLMANEFISTLNVSLGLGIAPLSDAEIFANAVPEPSTALLVCVGLSILGRRRNRRADR